MRAPAALARGEVLGLLNIQSRDRRDFTQTDEDLLIAIGNQIGIAIANAQLIDDAERRRATLDRVMNSLVDGLILVDRRDRIIYANPRAKEILDLPALDTVGYTFKELDRAIGARVARPEHTFSQLRAALADPQTTPTVEFTLTAPASRTVQARFFSIYDAGGGSLGLGIPIRDITREKELDEMKSQLLSTVSHELRTPLASIKGFATTLLRDDVEWDEASRREFLAIIDEESDRLTELIGNLLDMARIEAGTLRVEPEPTDLRPIIEGTVAGFRMMTRAHEIEVTCPLSCPPLWPILAGRGRVWRNLVENGVKYSPDGGPIIITARVRSDDVQTSVADRGIGIEEQQLEHIFDRFYQVEMPRPARSAAAAWACRSAKPS